MKTLVCHILCLCCVGAWAENLLANPGFDTLNLDGTPARWDVFIMPDNGASGQVDAVAHDGDYAAMLHTPKRYAKDPVNNWSQIIYDDLVGRRVELTGHIRTDDVNSAEIWIQCFMKRRSRILATATTLVDFPLSGTNGWTRVSTSLVPPVGTDFLVIRCVITGQGKAWFDSLSLVAESTEVEGPNQIEFLEPAEADAAVPTEEMVLDSADILAVSKAMQDTIRQLESDNRELLQRIGEIRTDLNQYRSELIQNRVNIDEQPPRYGKHPIVPHGYIVELDD